MAPRYGLPVRIDRQDGRFQATPVRGDLAEMVDLTRSDASTRSYTISFPSFDARPARRRRAA
jgi:hypothetical protein